MSGTRKDRRSRRIPASHRMLLTIIGGTGLEIAKEIVSTVELSQFGALVRGRRSMRPESEGMLTQLRSGRQARIRIAWQKKSGAGEEYFDTGIEIVSGFDYWGISFAEPVPEPAAAPVGVRALLDELQRATSGQAGGQGMEALWCGLIELLEAQQVIQRGELVAAVRGIAGLPKPERVKASSSGA